MKRREGTKVMAVLGHKVGDRVVFQRVEKERYYSRTQNGWTGTITRSQDEVNDILIRWDNGKELSAHLDDLHYLTKLHKALE